jgi:RNA polymerase sigma-70 factor (ECF subfamily)
MAAENAQPKHSTDLHKPEAYAPALRRYFQKRCEANEVEDLVQEVLLRMHSRRAETRIDNIGGYIFAVAAHVLSARRRDLAIARAGFDPDVAEVADTVTPERIVLARREIERVVQTIQALPPRTRDIFIAHRFEEMTYSAIARQFGISVSAVEKHIMAALRALMLAVRGQA